jgi:hypothetical protein
MSLLASRCLTSCNVGEDPGFDVIENFYMIERHKSDTASYLRGGPSEPKINHTNVQLPFEVLARVLSQMPKSTFR